MRLADIIKQCKEAGCSEVELHPDGSIARMVFGPVVERKKLTRAEEIIADRKRRNPRRDAMELADAIIKDRNPEANQ